MPLLELTEEERKEGACWQMTSIKLVGDREIDCMNMLRTAMNDFNVDFEEEQRIAKWFHDKFMEKERGA